MMIFKKLSWRTLEYRFANESNDINGKKKDDRSQGLGLHSCMLLEASIKIFEKIPRGFECTLFCKDKCM